MELARQIKNQRKALGLSQEDLAERIYVSRQTISNWETGRTYPDVESLLLLSTLFETSVDELIKGEVDTMRETQEQDAKRMNRLSWAMTLGVLAAIVIFLCGDTIWEWGLAPTLLSGSLMTALACVPAFEIERLKKKHDILTYAEISAFERGSEIDRSAPASIQARRHPAKRWILEVLAGAAVGGVVGFVFMLIIRYVFGWHPWSL